MAKQMMDIGMVPVLDITGYQVGEDLAVAAGDFTVVESTKMHERQLIANNKGEFKENPTICVGAINYIDEAGFNRLLNATSEELARDGMDVQQVALGAGGIIETDAFYK